MLEYKISGWICDETGWHETAIDINEFDYYELVYILNDGGFDCLGHKFVTHLNEDEKHIITEKIHDYIFSGNYNMLEYEIECIPYPHDYNFEPLHDTDDLPF